MPNIQRTDLLVDAQVKGEPQASPIPQHRQNWLSLHQPGDDASDGSALRRLRCLMLSGLVASSRCGDPFSAGLSFRFRSRRVEQPL